MKRKPLYIETHIACDPETIWGRTQDPGLHRLWNLRFSDLEYLPKPDAETRQRFLYSTRTGFGLQVDYLGTHQHLAVDIDLGVEYVALDGPGKIPVHAKPVREERRE
jgi:hypothetical protein